MTPTHHLLCTVGTSLFNNLQALGAGHGLARACAEKRWGDVAAELARLPGEDRTCGAEINSIASMIAKGYFRGDGGLFFFHSATDDGRAIAGILREYYRGRGHAPVEAVEVPDLQDADAKRFRTKGLRNLARAVCRVIRDYTPAACAINATGGYKAQIAVAVLLGQALGVPVYYKHERFPEIIAFPPLPVALDYEVWLRASGMLFDLERSDEPVPYALYAEEWDEKYESLVERVEIDGVEYLELTATGQIFHETFRERFRTARDKELPPPAPRKQPPRLEQAGWPGEHPEVRRFLERVTEEVPAVVQCATFYYNPDLPERTRFRLGSNGVEGVYSPGGYCVKFRVETTAQTPGQQAAVVAALNEWLAGQGGGG